MSTGISGAGAVPPHWPELGGGDDIKTKMNSFINDFKTFFSTNSFFTPSFRDVVGGPPYAARNETELNKKLEGLNKIKPEYTNEITKYIDQIKPVLDYVTNELKQLSNLPDSDPTKQKLIKDKANLENLKTNFEAQRTLLSQLNFVRDPERSDPDLSKKQFFKIEGPLGWQMQLKDIEHYKPNFKTVFEELKTEWS